MLFTLNINKQCIMLLLICTFTETSMALMFNQRTITGNIAYY